VKAPSGSLWVRTMDAGPGTDQEPGTKHQELTSTQNCNNSR
jgi:hypothetical protein